MQAVSIISYYGRRPAKHCGYCGKDQSKFTHGMWTHSLTVDDYQDLIDRGWRRSGKYCYKPTMNKTCCPQYPIRCAALEFKISKSQKKTLKQIYRYVNSDIRSQGCEDDLVKDDAGRHGNSQSEQCTAARNQGNTQGTREKAGDTCSSQGSNKSKPTKGQGPDPDKPPCKKAKQLRLERKQQKLAAQGISMEANVKSSQQEAKPLRQLLEELTAGNPKHKLEIKTVRSSPRSEDFDSTFNESYSIYKKYQMAIHGDSAEELTKKQFTRFLVDSPLQECYKADGVDIGYGSFHQQYWLDGQLIAVGVLDILPRCISSVYLYYNPSFSFLSPGTFTALREIDFICRLNSQDPSLKYYYMGYYIHSCPKMRYKGQYYPSFLACPEVYSWVPIEKCRPKLDVSKYSRLEEDMTAVDENANINVNHVTCLYERRAMPYEIYKARKGSDGDRNEVLEYARLTGRKLAGSLLLYRS